MKQISRFQVKALMKNDVKMTLGSVYPFELVSHGPLIVLPKHEERENQPKRKCRAANDSMSSY